MNIQNGGAGLSGRARGELGLSLISTERSDMVRCGSEWDSPVMLNLARVSKTDSTLMVGPGLSRMAIAAVAT